MREIKVRHMLPAEESARFNPVIAAEESTAERCNGRKATAERAGCAEDEWRFGAVSSAGLLSYDFERNAASVTKGSIQLLRA